MDINFKPSQIAYEKKRLHKLVHWLLIYKEQEYESLDLYFDKLLSRIAGMNSIFNYPPEMIELLSTLEAARNTEDFTKYRTFVFDAHSVIDKIKEVD